MIHIINQVFYLHNPHCAHFGNASQCLSGWQQCQLLCRRQQNLAPTTHTESNNSNNNHNKMRTATATTTTITRGIASSRLLIARVHIESIAAAAPPIVAACAQLGQTVKDIPACRLDPIHNTPCLPPPPFLPQRRSTAAWRSPDWWFVYFDWVKISFSTRAARRFRQCGRSKVTSPSRSIPLPPQIVFVVIVPPRCALCFSSLWIIIYFFPTVFGGKYEATFQIRPSKFLQFDISQQLIESC